MKITDYLKQQGWCWQYTDLDDNGTIQLIWSIMPLPGEAIDYEKKIGDSWYNIKHIDTTGRTMIIKRYLKRNTSSIGIMDLGTSTITPIENTNSTYLTSDTLFDGIIQTVEDLTTVLKTLSIL